MQRRTLLRVSGISAALLGLAGGGVVWLSEPVWRDGHLSPAARSMFAAIARAVVDKLPAANAISALDAHLARLDATIAGFAPAMQAEVAQLAALLVHAPGRVALTGLRSTWAQASTSELRATLERMRMSAVLLRRQVYHALRDLTNAAWFADPTSWQAIGYPGPRPL